MTLKQRLTAILNSLTSSLSAINTSLVSKGASAVSDISDVSGAIDTISTGVTPTGTISITQNGQTDVTNYATADVAVTTDADRILTIAKYLGFNSVSLAVSDRFSQIVVRNNNITSCESMFNYAYVTDTVVLNVPNCTNFRQFNNYGGLKNITIEACSPAYFGSFTTQKPLTTFILPPNVIQSTASNNSPSFGCYPYTHSDSALISIANGLMQSATYKYVKLEPTNSARCDLITGNVNADGLFVADSSGSTTLTQFITQTKGWTIT